MLVEIFGLHQSISWYAKYYFIKRDKLRPFYAYDLSLPSESLILSENLDKTWDSEGLDNLRDLLSDQRSSQKKAREFSDSIFQDARLISETYHKNIVARMKENMNSASNENDDNNARPGNMNSNSW